MNSILQARSPSANRAAAKPVSHALRRRRALVRWLIISLLLTIVSAAFVRAICWRCSEARYDAAQAMRVPLAAAPSADYDDRRLLLIQRDATHYDFVLEPTADHVARVVLANVDVSPLAPQVNTTGYSVGAAQQLTIDARNRRVEVRGGDGFEAARLASITIASDRGHASGWSVTLEAQAGRVREIYYRGQFHFPLGHYRELFEQTTQLNYADYRHELEAETPLVASEASESLLR